MRRRRWAVAALAVAVAAAGCADDGPAVLVVEEGPAAAEPTGAVADVEAVDNTFDADRLVVAPGTEVRWTNAGQNEHDVVAVGGLAWGVDQDAFRPGGTYSHVFTAPGEYPYYCSLHGTPTAGMVGVIVVEAAAA
jgi:plastocyanin